MNQREEGRIAHCDGKTIMVNPHPINSAEWNHWRLGWLNADRQNRRFSDEAVHVETPCGSDDGPRRPAKYP